MNEKSLACFAAAARTGSFSVAGWELSVTQQNVSYNIRRLEEELGFPLFVRQSQRVELTAGGEDFLAWYKAFDEAARLACGQAPGAGPEGLVTDTQIKCFLAVAETGDMETAAEKLIYAPQTLSGILTGLEKALGLRLLTRDRGVSRLTEAGKIYQKLFSDAAASLSQVTEKARRRYENAKKTAVAGVSHWLNPAGPLGRAIEGFPDAVMVKTMSNPALLAALKSGGVDVALWSEGHTPANLGLDITPVAEEALCVFVPEKGGPCPILVCPGWPRSFLENRAISAQETVFADFSPAGTVLVESLEAMTGLLRTGAYAAVGDLRFGPFGDIPGLRAIPLGAKTHIMACRRSNAGDTCAARLIRWLKTALVGDTKN